jgi:hypothetical protein
MYFFSILSAVGLAMRGRSGIFVDDAVASSLLGRSEFQWTDGFIIRLKRQSASTGVLTQPVKLMQEGSEED